MSQIKITYQGEFQLDSATRCLNPTATVTTCVDDMIETVRVECVFENLSYSYGRGAGSFIYGETWTNEDVVNHLNLWMESRKIAG